jgi:Uma2 family endonuclease
MTTAIAQPKALTFTEFLENEQRSEVKHEFHKGKTKEMAGGSQRHSEIALNIGAFIKICIMRKTEEFHAYGSDMAIYMPPIDKSVYSDVCVVEGKPIGIDGTKLTIVNPKLIIEVASPSTMAYDRGDKFKNYRLLPAFREYILVSQNEPTIDCYYLKDAKKGIWLYQQINGLEESVRFQSIGCTVRLKDIYNNLSPIED